MYRSKKLEPSSRHGFGAFMSGQRSYLMDMIDSRCIPYGDLRHACNSKTVPSRVLNQDALLTNLGGNFLMRPSSWLSGLCINDRDSIEKENKTLPLLEIRKTINEKRVRDEEVSSVKRLKSMPGCGIQLPELRNCRQKPTDDINTMLSLSLFSTSSGDPVSWDEYLARIWIRLESDHIYPHGSTDTLPFATMGSGSLASMSVFEAKYKEGLTRDEGIKLVAEAICSGIFNDLGSGSNVDLCVITKVTSIFWKDNELNMVDTPGHADFGGEV
ncbi:Nucleophile aminohydrolases N-terminal [Arabidopsis thaliana x Arabidopsis arenosa]|nr:Nucleophile aminohydrolases N-terminal [Arabidopsis thaliana x Arabidopsis arenosa]